MSFLTTASSFAQIEGKILDTEGYPLAFATVYIEGTTLGTSSNLDGEYELVAPAGKYRLVYQYVGYATKIKEIDYDGKAYQLNMALEEEAVSITEVVVTADGEDPAYRIIRNAIKKREYYRKLVQAFSNEAYIKSTFRWVEIPKTFMGMDMEEELGTIDSMDSNIIYLSESVNKLYYEAPNNYKEEMVSSKVSGNQDAFSFNMAQALEFNCYENYFDGFERKIISPIADNALSYYDYRLESAYYDDYGNLINKISVLPKRGNDPTYRGTIYIIEDLWLIHSLKLMLVKSNFKIDFLDTLTISQVNIPVEKPDVWLPFQKNFYFKISMFGIGANGDMIGVYKNYDLAPDFPKGFFGNEIMIVKEDANEKDSSYWKEIRPIPLTEIETRDYEIKDSIEILESSESYQDSMDHIYNKFTWRDLISDYTYRNTYDKWSITLKNPLNTIQYNTVQGYQLGTNLSFRKNYDKINAKWFQAGVNAEYGFTEKTFRAAGNLSYNFNRTNFARVSLAGGYDTQQFNGDNPISETFNTTTTLTFRRNYIKIYERYFAQASYRQEVINGLFLSASLSYEDRLPLINQSGISYWFREKRTFTSNDPRRPDTYGEASFARHQALIANLSLRIRFKQAYLSYPNRKLISGSKYPEFTINYRKAIPLGNTSADFDLLSLKMTDNFSLGLVGSSSLLVEGGIFLTENNVPFIDHRHFLGNRTYFSLSRRQSEFFLLPYYERSTDGKYLEAHYQHAFNGYLLDKIPGIRRLKWSLVLSGKYLYTDPSSPLLGNQKSGHYSEVALGIDKIGFGLFKIIRVDGVVVFSEGFKPSYGMVVSIGL